MHTNIFEILRYEDQDDVIMDKKLKNLNNNDLSELSDDDDTNTETDGDGISFEIIEHDKSGKSSSYIYKVSKDAMHNEKRLLCFSVLNNQICSFRNKCTYAHDLDEQIIDIDRKFVYQIVLDNNLMDFFSITNPKTDEIYKALLLMTQVCDNCINGRCTGGYNCKHGVLDTSLKLCKNDLMMGECINKIQTINVNPLIFEKIDNITKSTEYKGCLNGHHLTFRGFLPYYKFLNTKEKSKKNSYQSTRYIDINSILKFCENNNNVQNDSFIKPKFGNEENSSTSDEELNELFRKDKFFYNEKEEEEDDSL
jgi:hypothetical protein